MDAPPTTLLPREGRDRGPVRAPFPPGMKLRILLGALLWTLLITGLHVWANVGFTEFGRAVRVLLGVERPTLRVGFLPVT